MSRNASALIRSQSQRNRFEGRTGINSEEAWYEIVDHVTGRVFRRGGMHDNYHARRCMQRELDEREG